MKKKLLILIDGSFYLYRSYYGFFWMSNNFGNSIGAIYGILNMLNNLFLWYSPDYIGITFDISNSKSRKILFKEYKSNRKPMPKALFEQIKPLYELINLIGIPILSIQGIEADDIIGTLSLEAKKDDCEVLIITNDKDMSQLVSSSIKIVDMKKKPILTGKNEVIKKFGVLPNLVVDYLALVGDKSDNIPGVPGIGKKTAIYVLNNIGGLNLIYKKLNEVEMLNFKGFKNLSIKLKKNKEIALISYKLAKIKTNIFLNFSYSSLIMQKRNYAILASKFRNYRFNTLEDNLKKLYKS